MKRGWRTGSPTRLDALLANQSWDPLQMFGGTQRTAAPSASAVAAPAVQPAKAGSSTPTIANFVLPEWCSAAAATGVLLAWRGATLVDTVPLAGRAYLLAGRLAECDLVLEHASASRHHAIVLQHRSGAVYLLDLGSAHGTFLNGERLPPREPTTRTMAWCSPGATTSSAIAASRCLRRRDIACSMLVIDLVLGCCGSVLLVGGRARILHARRVACCVFFAAPL